MVDAFHRQSGEPGGCKLHRVLEGFVANTEGLRIAPRARQEQLPRERPETAPRPAGLFSSVTGQDAGVRCPTGNFRHPRSSRLRRLPIGDIIFEYIINKLHHMRTRKGPECDRARRLRRLCDRFVCMEDWSGISLCAAGRVAPDTNSMVCTDCQPGRAQGGIGQGSCEDCQIGSIASNAKETSCTLCAAGTYAPDVMSTACIDCDPGTAQGGTGQGSCDDCLAGTTAVAGSTACELCAAGEVAPGARSTECIACDKGKFQGSTGSTVCIDCPEGQAASKDAAQLVSCVRRKICCRAEVDKLHRVPARKSGGAGQATRNDCSAGAIAATPGEAACAFARRALSRRRPPRANAIPAPREISAEGGAA